MSDVQKVVRNGVKQQILLDSSVGTQEATSVLGHEVFVHADKDADALTEIEKNQGKQTLEDVRNINLGADSDHRALGAGKVSKFQQFLREVTRVTNDKYYEEEYQRQVDHYKNRF